MDETQVAVSDDAVPSSGWCSVRPVAADPFRGARPGGCFQDVAALAMTVSSDRPASKTPPAIPLDVFVSVGRDGPVAGAPPRRGAGPRSANDNRPARGVARSVWRDVILLALLAATVAGAFYSGRLHAAYKVIVVPGPVQPGTVVT